MKKIHIDIAYLIVMVILTAVITVVAVLTLLNENPRIDATGEYALWNTPISTNFDGFLSYARVDVRNVGDAVAKELKLLTPFDGIYSLDGEEDAQDFSNNIVLADLNPGEGHIIEIWSRGSLSRIYLNRISITHTKGIKTVDFGYQTKGIIGKISRNLDRYGLLYLPLSLFGLFALIAYIVELRKRSKGGL